MTDWVPPAPEEVSRVVGFLVDANLRRQFFADLRNPLWVDPLDEMGVFDDIPQVWVDEGGVERARPWPEGEYLSRMAEAEPERVVSILGRQTDSNNPWVNSVLLDAALALPPEQAVLLAQKLAGAIERGWSSLDAEAVVRLAELLAPDHSDAMRRLLSALFGPSTGGEEVAVFGTRTRVTSAIDDYWYGELAPRAVPLLSRLGMTGLKLATGWLLKAIEITSPGHNRTSIWRPSIAPHEQNDGSDDIGDALIDIVRDVAVEVAGAGSLREVVSFLEARESFLLRRIALETAAELAARSLESDDLDVALRLLLDESLLDIDARPEYVRLARALLPRLSTEHVAAWQAMVVAERWQGPDDLMRRLAAGWDNDPEAVTAEEIAAVRRRLTYRLLLPLDEALPPDQRDRLAALRDEFGELEHPEFGSYSVSFVGPTSPHDAAALGDMSPDELFVFLQAWQPDEARGFGPSVEGLARELAGVAERRPELLAAIAPRLLELPRAYVRAALTGWAKAVPLGFELPSEVWDLMTELVAVPDNGDDEDGDWEADDPVWRWAQRSALDLVTAYLGVRGDRLAMGDARRAWDVVAPLTSHPDPTPEHEQRYGGDNMDPLTLSLNTTRPAALRAATEVLRRLPDAEDDGDAAAFRDDILAVLARHVSSDDDPSLAVAAVFGETLGRLAHISRSWVDARASALLDVLSQETETRQHADVVVSVALRVYRTSSPFIELMRGVMEAMFSLAYWSREHIDGWRGGRSAVVEAATHVLRAYVLGYVDEDDPLMSALTGAESPPGVFGDALGHLGWEIMHALRDETEGSVAPEVLDRARHLIDSRVEEIREGRAQASELSGFYWWVRADAFEPGWWLPILHLAATDSGFDPKGLLGEAIAAAADREPAQVLDVFEVLRRRSDGWERYDMLRHAPRILAAALLHGDEVTQRQARGVLNALGRDGHLSILADVDRLTSETR